MRADLLTKLSQLHLTSEEAARFGLSSLTLTLRRSWPQSAEQLGLEYVSGAGEIVPGQWFSDFRRLEQVASETHRRAPAASSTIVDVEGISILLQRRGADRKLTGLAPLLAIPNARLVVHRPEKRAVVRLNNGGQAQYAKIVAPDRVARLVENSAALERLAGRSFTIPRLLDADVRRGVTLWSALPGTSLHDLLHEASYHDAAFASGRALRNLHDLPLPQGIGYHTATAEAAVVEHWMRMLKEFVPQWADRIADRVAVHAVHVTERLMAAATPARLLHRDFYDKQIFWYGSGQISLLDFDTLSAGEAALDVANALVHFELRALMGDCPFAHSQEAASAFLEGYAPDQDTLDRLPAYQAASTLRLLCVYAFRPPAWKILPALLARLDRGMKPIPASLVTASAGSAASENKSSATTRRRQLSPPQTTHAAERPCCPGSSA